MRSVVIRVRAACLILMACSSSSSTAPPSDGGLSSISPEGGPRATVDASTPERDAEASVPDASANDDLETLIEESWRLEGQEMYLCVRRTLPETVHIREFYPIIPRGTHHTVLTIDDGRRRDGAEVCDGFVNGPEVIYGSGVGTEPLTMPEGVAVTIEAGQQILLNLHLFNTGGGTLEGTSGIQVRRADPVEVETAANIVMAGAVDIAIPPRSTATVDGECTFQQASTVFAGAPHMHQLGTRLTAVLHRTGQEPQTIFEDIYSFDDQRYRAIESLAIEPGDRVEVRCEYENPGDTWVTFGESTNNEMCFFTMYRYPAHPTFGTVCIN